MFPRPDTLSLPMEVDDTVTWVLAPDASATVPATCKVPEPAAPRDSVPPLLTVMDGVAPLPPKLPPEFTVTPEELRMEPFTTRAPPLTVVAPV